MKTITTNRPRPTIRLVAIAIALLISAHRLPAPISEAPQSTPAPTTSLPIAPPEQVRTAPAASVSPPASKSTTGRFAGTWSGRVPFKNPFAGGGGDQQCDLIVNAEENSVIIRVGKPGGGAFHTATAKLVVIGNTATGKGGFLKHMNITLTLTSDPNTASMVVHDTIWGTSSGTVKRIN